MFRFNFEITQLYMTICTYFICINTKNEKLIYICMYSMIKILLLFCFVFYFIFVLASEIGKLDIVNYHCFLGGVLSINKKSVH